MSKLIQLASVAGLVLGVVFWTATPALSQENLDTNRVDLTAMSVAERQDEVLCRAIQPTGTRLYIHVCLTRGEWATLREENRVAMEALVHAGTEIGT